MEKDNQQNGGIKLENGGVSDNFGLLLKNYREKKGYTLKQLEEMAKVSPSYISRIENAERKEVSFPKVIRLAVCLGVPYSALIATAFSEAVSEEFVREESTLTNVLIREEYTVNGQEMNIDDKKALIKIIEFLSDCSWSGKSKMQDMYRLSEMIEDLKARF